MKLNEEQRLKLKRLAEEHGISLILVFGSGVNGQQHPQSDFDVAILLEKERDLPYREYSELFHKLQEILHNQPLDLSLINHADPLFLKKLQRTARFSMGPYEGFRSLRFMPSNVIKTISTILIWSKPM